VYVIVYSLRAGINEHDIHQHLMNVTVRCRDAPIVLVGTHSDVMCGDPDLPLESLRTTYPQVRYLRATACFRPCSVVNHSVGVCTICPLT
jgi:hypothetical protein